MGRPGWSAKGSGTVTPLSLGPASLPLDVEPSTRTSRMGRPGDLDAFASSTWRSKISRNASASSRHASAREMTLSTKGASYCLSHSSRQWSSRLDGSKRYDRKGSILRASCTRTMCLRIEGGEGRVGVRSGSGAEARIRRRARKRAKIPREMVLDGAIHPNAHLNCWKPSSSRRSRAR